MNPAGEDLVAVAETAGEFEAQTKAAILRDAGIEAVVYSNSGAWSGYVTFSPAGIGATVLVRREDASRARAVLRETIADSVDLDWDSVDVGEREDRLPLHRVNGMPIAARIGFAIAAALVVLSMFGVLTMFR
jgi:hypothetical protein